MGFPNVKVQMMVYLWYISGIRETNHINETCDILCLEGVNLNKAFTLYIVIIVCGVCTGYYWIDPNEGCTSDAEYVFCDFENKRACVQPKKENVR